MLSDYQQFDIIDGRLTNVGERMKKKLQAIPIPPLQHLDVLDVGCDAGFWCWLAKQEGAKRVLGLDRNRPVNGVQTNLIAENRKVAASHPKFEGVEFEHINLGREWREFGKFDVIFMFSMYHHVFENCGDHQSIWFWLSRHLKPGGMVIWEGPMDRSDAVVQINVTQPYERHAILSAASEYFEYVHVGPALHEPTREVYAFRLLEPVREEFFEGQARDGAGGATPAFKHNDGARIKEISHATGMTCIPGSLNVKLTQPFPWNRNYYRAKISDVVDRKKTINSKWAPRWARFYPVDVEGVPAFVFRFEGERYCDDFVELISDRRLRDLLPRNDQVEIVL